MTDVCGNHNPVVSTHDVASEEFYGVGYDDSDKRIPGLDYHQETARSEHGIQWLSLEVHVQKSGKLFFMDFHGHRYDDDEDFEDGKWAMEVIERTLERAFRQPPKFSSLDRYLNHQYILLETDVDDAGNAPETVKEDCFPGNLNPRHTFSLEGTVSASKKRPPKGWSYWDSTLEKERQLYIMTDSMNKRLQEQYWNQGRVVPVFRDERLKSRFYPKFVRDDISQQEMRISFYQEIE